jgi:CheY-like chemotaxis protein/HPt (histidine-containing phosphotransfer) domain-containing protein
MAPAEAPSAAEGLVALLEAQAAGRPFQLILLDAHMPEVSGFGFAERARRLPGQDRVPMVLLTSAGSRGDADLCSRLGISAYLIKPAKQSELRHTIAAVLDPRLAQGGQGSVVTRHALREARRKLRVLFAEDNPVNQRVGAAILEKKGHAVTLAANGREALRALEGETFNLVLMDVQMPEMDGLEAARLIRDRERAKGGHVPIVAMTAHALKGDRERCLEAGMDDYIAKPIRPAALIETVERLATAGRDCGLKSEIASPQSEMPLCPVFDREAALQAVGGDPVLLREVTGIFIEDSPKRIEEARSALGRGDAAALSRAAHTLKGAAGAVCACSVQRAARDLEAAARSGPNGPCAHLLETLQAQFDMFRSAVESEV